MLKHPLLTGSSLENLDRGVILAAIAGLLANAYDRSVAGFFLIAIATGIYGALRNRLENLNTFEDEFVPPTIVGVNVGLITFLCQWFGSRDLYYGLLTDLTDPEMRDTGSAKQYLREAVLPALLLRARMKVLGLFWLERA